MTYRSEVPCSRGRGEWGAERAEHLQDVAVPMLFLQGTRDSLAEVAIIPSRCQSVPAVLRTKGLANSPIPSTSG